MPVMFWVMLALLAAVTSFGISTSINMLFKRWWLSLVIYAGFSLYLFINLGTRMLIAEWVLYAVGLFGAAFSAWGVRLLKKRGYALFS